jgi:hypothetical protein
VVGPLPTDQVNLTDEDSRIMRVPGGAAQGSIGASRWNGNGGGGFEQCYNAQAVVAAVTLLVIAADLVQAPNDKQQLEPMPDKIVELPDAFGKVGTLLADKRHFGEANVNACAADRSGNSNGPRCASSLACRTLRGCAATSGVPKSA